MTEFVGHSISGGAATFRYAAAKAELLADRKAVEEALDAEEQNTGEFLSLILAVLDEWDTLPASRLRDMLAKLIRVIVVTRTGVRTPPRVEIIPVWNKGGVVI
jgi:hypothetical protein